MHDHLRRGLLPHPEVLQTLGCFAAMGNGSNPEQAVFGEDG
jgi:hypothetical protein